MEPQSVLEADETESPGLKSDFLPPVDQAAAVSIGVLVQPILLRCAVKVMLNRSQPR
jgi:hypothetical protein